MKSTIVAFGFILLLSCQPQKPATSDKENEEMKNPDAAHTSQNALDWDGVYRGSLPCADCEGIETTVELKKDMSFKTKTIYVGKSDSVYETTGKMSWNEKGNTVTLTPSDNSQATQYFVGEGVLTQLDKDGTKITGDNAARYLLSKSQYEILEKYWTLVELNGRGVAMDSTFIREPHIIFKSGGRRIIGNGGCNGFSGEYKIESLNRITMSKILSTRMACPKMDLEGEFLDVLQKADNFNIAGDSLSLNKARMAPLARFKAVYLK